MAAGQERSFVAPAVLALVVGLLIAVASVAAQAPDVTTVELKVGDGTRFRPSEIHARPGERLRVVITYVGKMAKSSVAHDFVLLKKGTNAKDFAEKVGTKEQPDFGERSGDCRDDAGRRRRDCRGHVRRPL